MWDEPASPFVYGFLGDVNRLPGRVHDGVLHLDGAATVPAPEYSAAQHAEAFAFVRPHELDIQRHPIGHLADTATGPQGIAARLDRAIVIGPMARLEFMPLDRSPHPDQVSRLIEAHIPTQQFLEQAFQEGDTVILSPRKARAFLQHSR